MNNDEYFNIERPKDNLTHVYSREVIIDYVNQLVADGTPFTFALVDIDNFKYVNDTYGHIAGDKILKTVSNRLVKLIGSIGTVARYGGDRIHPGLPPAHRLRRCLDDMPQHHDVHEQL